MLSFSVDFVTEVGVADNDKPIKSLFFPCYAFVSTSKGFGRLKHNY